MWIKKLLALKGNPRADMTFSLVIVSVSPFFNKIIFFFCFRQTNDMINCE